MTSKPINELVDLSTISSLPEGFSVRRLAHDDLEKGILDVLKTLTVVEPITPTQYKQHLEYIERNRNTLYVLVVQQNKSQKIAAVGTILLEQKLIHGLGIVGHIEDIAVAEEFQGQKLGQRLIDILESIAKIYGAYKCILNCSEDVKNFYERCSYTSTGHMMTKRF